MIETARGLATAQYSRPQQQGNMLQKQELLTHILRGLEPYLAHKI